MVNDTKTKIRKPNIAVKPITKFCGSGYADSWRSFPISNARLEQLALEYEQDVEEHTEILHLVEWRVLKGIHRRSFEDFLKRCPALKEAHQHVKDILTVRRDKGAATNAFNSAYITSSMPTYSFELQEQITWLSSLRQKENAALSATYNIIKTQDIELPNMSLPDVPEKPKNETGLDE